MILFIGDTATKRDHYLRRLTYQQLHALATVQSERCKKRYSMRRVLAYEATLAEMMFRAKDG